MVEMAEPLVKEQEVPWVVEAAPEPAAPQIKEGHPEPVAELPIEETEVPEAVPQPVAPMVEVAEPLVEEQEVLQAVEAAPEPDAPRVEEEPPPVAEPDPVPGDEPAVPELTQVVTGMAEFRAQLAAEPGDHVTRLALARALLDDDALNHALLEYGALVAAGQELDDVVEDLELIVPSNPANTLALRTLGDAHMKQGELGKALKAYRQALAHL
jgi:tetratricopeptide (TPR) repeat protein